jgi:hypothetical protein
MLRFSSALLFVLVIAFSTATSSSALADTWGCSYEKCIAVCGKAGGKYCSSYCTKELQEKQRSKVCK